MPRVVEPVVFVIVAHQQQAVLVALPCKVGAIGQQPVVTLFRHGLEIQRRPEHHRHPGVDIRAKLCRRLAALVHDFELVGCALVFQSAVQGLDDAGRIAAVAGVVVGVAGVDLPRVRAVEFSVLLPVRGVGQVAGDEGIRVDVDAHGLEQHDAADALAAVDPALSLVDVRGRNDFFHQNASQRRFGPVKTERSVLLCRIRILYPTLGIFSTTIGTRRFLEHEQSDHRHRRRLRQRQDHTGLSAQGTFRGGRGAPHLPRQLLQTPR